MTNAKPRIPPLDESELTDEMRKSLEPWRVKGRVFNIFLTSRRHPMLAKAWYAWGVYVFSGSTLTPRQREILILRTTWLAASVYEFAHHTIVARRSGLSDLEILQIAEGDTAKFGAVEAGLIDAATELERDAVVSDATWEVLAREFDQHRLMDVVYTCGTYRIGSIATNTFGTPLDANIPISPALLPLIDRIGRQPRL